jgi:HK97 family phage major capsid protein
MPEILGKDFRTLHFRAEAVNADGTLDISFSSETDQVERWFGIEILSHEPGAMDMTRAALGLPFLCDHDSECLVGRVENIRIGPDRKGRGTVRFSSGEEAQQIRQDMVDGIRPDISVGYLRVEETTTKGQGNASDIVLVTRWMPFEISTVAIPADISVGAGRSTASPAVPLNPPADPAGTTKEVRMDPNTTVAAPAAAVPAPPPAPAAQASPTQAPMDARSERVEVLQLQQLAEKRGVGQMALEVLGSDKPLSEARALIMAEVTKRDARPAPAPTVDPTAKEMREYSITRAINALATRENCPEFEISQELAKRMNRGTEGFYMPTNVGSRAGLDSATATKGAELKYTEPGDFIQLLRNRSRVFTLGARLYPGLQGKVAFQRQTGAGTASWLATENPGSDVAESNLLLDQVLLDAKTLITTTSYSKQLLLQAAVGVEQIVRNDLAAIIALAVDLAAINGSGGTGQPRGILNTSGIGSVAMGTNGAAITSIAPLVDLETKVTTANADLGSLGYLTTPGQRGVFKKTPAFSTAGASPIWTDAAAGSIHDGMVNGYGACASSQVPNTLVKGTSGAVCHAVLFGNWAELLVGEWGALEILTDPYRLKKQGMIELTATYFCDVAIKHAASFAAIVDAL